MSTGQSNQKLPFIQALHVFWEGAGIGKVLQDNIKNHINVFSWTILKESFTTRNCYTSATQWIEHRYHQSVSWAGEWGHVLEHLFNLSCLPQDDNSQKQKGPSMESRKQHERMNTDLTVPSLQLAASTYSKINDPNQKKINNQS